MLYDWLPFKVVDDIDVDGVEVAVGGGGGRGGGKRGGQVQVQQAITGLVRTEVAVAVGGGGGRVEAREVARYRYNRQNRISQNRSSIRRTTKRRKEGCAKYRNCF